jgi:hypothetical protein
LNDGTIVPLILADEPGHFRVAWANDVTTHQCARGVILTLDFDLSDCLDTPGCISLSSLSLLDHQRLIDVPSFANANTTVLGGAECVANHLPVVHPIADQTIGVHSTLSVQAQVVDVDGDRVLWNSPNLPQGALLTVGTGLLIWTPVAGQQGVHSITIVGDDHRGGLDSAAFSVTVTNRAPIFTELGAHQALPNHSFNEVVAPDQGVGSLGGTGVTMRDCTIAYNSTSSSNVTAGIYVSFFSSPSIVNSILWGIRSVNRPPIVIESNSTHSMTYCDVQAPYPGTGNITANPLFCNARRDRFALRPASPCIGAGEGGTTIGAYDNVCRGDATSDRIIQSVAEPPHITFAPLNGAVPTVAAHGSHALAFALPHDTPVTLRLLDATGALRATLIDNVMPAGEHRVQWDGRDERGRVAAGVYVLRREANGARRGVRVVRLAGP